jgi:hypothetical protein
MSDIDAPAPRPEDELPSAGWYPDPWSQQPLRWWDGVRWTAETAEPAEVDRRAS